MVGGVIRLSAADRARLAGAIKDGEARSSAELVLVIAESCGDYRILAFLWPAIAVLLLGGVLALAAPGLATPRPFLIQAAVFVLLSAFLHWRPLLWRVVPPGIRRAHAAQVAAHQFALRVSDRTPACTGVLLFLALAERQVFLLPDSGVSAVIDSTAWLAIIDRLAAVHRSGPPVEALATAIGEILAVLERHFPHKEQSGGVLSDEVIELPGGSRSGFTNTE